MVKIFFITLTLLVTSFPSFGEWEKITSNELGDMYLDSQNIRKNNEYLYYWALINFKNTKEEDAKSMLIYNQTDCNILRTKRLNVKFYSNLMGRGKNIHSFSDNKEWVYPPPNTDGEKEIKFVCASIK